MGDGWQSAYNGEAELNGEFVYMYAVDPIGPEKLRSAYSFAVTEYSVMYELIDDNYAPYKVVR